MRLFILLIFTLLPTLASALNYLEGSRKIAATPQLNGVAAFVLYEPDSETIILAHHARESRPSASLSKLMTSYRIAEALQKSLIAFEDFVPISEKAWRTAGSRMFLEVGTLVSVEDLLRGLIIQSANDASVALAEFMDGSEDVFAQIMNDTALRLGLQDSFFINSTGLDETAGTNHMSALDVALLAHHLIDQHTAFYKKFYANKSFSYNNIAQKNRNTLLWVDDTVDGIKTGYTRQAGYALAASAERDGMRLIAVVMGAESAEHRAEEALKLLHYGFRHYQKQTLFDVNVSWRTLPVQEGRQNQVPIGFSTPLTVLIPRGEEQQLSAILQAPDMLLAPLEAGQPVGSVEVQFGKETIVTHPVVVSKSVASGHLLKIWWDRVRYRWQ